MISMLGYIALVCNHSRQVKQTKRLLSRPDASGWDKSDGLREHVA